MSLVPPGTTVRYRYRGRSEHLYAHLRIPAAGPEHTIPVVQGAGPELTVLTSLLREAVAAVPGSPERTRAEVRAALWRIIRLTRAPAQRHGPHPAFGAAVAHVEAHLAEPLTVPEIARAAGVSHNHLIRLCRAATGDTVVAYVRRRGLDRAHHLLRETPLSIPAIAASVGICDLQSFNKACRRELGASPRSLRASPS